MNKCPLEGVVLPVESVTDMVGSQEHLFLINCILFLQQPAACMPYAFFLAKQGFFIAKVTL